MCVCLQIRLTRLRFRFCSDVCARVCVLRKGQKCPMFGLCRISSQTAARLFVVSASLKLCCGLLAVLSRCLELLHLAHVFLHRTRAPGRGIFPACSPAGIMRNRTADATQHFSEFFSFLFLLFFHPGDGVHERGVSTSSGSARDAHRAG